MPLVPALPYASDGGTIARRTPPTCIDCTACSKPGITALVPSLNVYGVLVLSCELPRRVPYESVPAGS
jgi:hypothetical protein